MRPRGLSPRLSPCRGSGEGGARLFRAMCGTGIGAEKSWHCQADRKGWALQACAVLASRVGVVGRDGMNHFLLGSGSG